MDQLAASWVVLKGKGYGKLPCPSTVAGRNTLSGQKIHIMLSLKCCEGINWMNILVIFVTTIFKRCIDVIVSVLIFWAISGFIIDCTSEFDMTRLYSPLLVVRTLQMFVRV